MSPAYDTREKYERWHIRVCARCGRQAAKAANWSDGPICRTCFDKATRTHGSCPGCRSERLLAGRLCHRCTLTDRLSALLDDGTGRIHPPLAPLFDRILTMQRTKSGLAWLTRAQPRALLEDLAKAGSP